MSSLLKCVKIQFVIMAVACVCSAKGETGLMRGQETLQAQLMLSERVSFQGSREEFQFYFSDPEYDPFDAQNPACGLNLIATAKTQSELATALDAIGSAVFLSYSYQSKSPKRTLPKKSTKQSQVLVPVYLEPSLKDMVAILTAALASPLFSKEKPGQLRFAADPRKEQQSDPAYIAAGFLDRDNTAEEFLRLINDFLLIGKSTFRPDWAKHFVLRLLQKPRLPAMTLNNLLGLHSERTIELSGKALMRIVQLSPEVTGPERPFRPRPLVSVAQAIRDQGDHLTLSERMDILMAAMLKDREQLASGEFAQDIYKQIYQSEILRLASEPNRSMLRAQYFRVATQRAALAALSKSKQSLKSTAHSVGCSLHLPGVQCN